MMDELGMYADRICIYCSQELMKSNGIWFCPDCDYEEGE